MLILTFISVVFLVHETYGFSCIDTTLKGNNGNVELEFSANENYWHKNESGHYFDCSMKHYKAVSDNIEWTKDGISLNFFYPSLKFQYLGPKNSILVFPDSNKYSGSYTCTVVNSFMKTMRKFEVPPTDKPFIFVPKNKRDIVVYEGRNVRFKCIVSKNYTQSWRWLYYSKRIGKTKRNRMKNYHFLKIWSVTKKDEGLYTCSVKNKFGTSEKYYNLKVKTKKKLLRHKKPYLVKNYTSLPEIVMNNLTVSCFVKGEKPMSVSWFKDGVPIEKVERQKGFSYIDEKQSLVLLSLQPEDKGKYTCIFQNQYGSLSHTIDVVPIEYKGSAPYFIGKKKQEIPYYVSLGHDINVTVEVAVFNTAHFQLLLHYNTTQNKSNSNEQRTLRVLSTPRDIIYLGPEYNRTGNDAFRYKLIFKFHNVSQKDFASYSIMGGNTFGYDIYQFKLISKANQKAKKKLLRHKKPYLVKNYTSLPEIVMKNLTVSCFVKGEKPMNVSWFKDGVPIEKVERQKGFSYIDEKQSLVLLSLQHEDKGKYTCIFQNQYGSLSHTIDVVPIERTFSAPNFIGKKKQEIPYYVSLGHDINVTVEVVVFNTAHFQLLLHYNTTQNKSNSNEQGTVRVLSTPRDIIYLGPEYNRTGNDAFRYKLIFKFHNVSQKDFASYSIMGGNTFGYDIYQFKLMNKANQKEQINGTKEDHSNTQHTF